LRYALRMRFTFFAAPLLLCSLAVQAQLAPDTQAKIASIAQATLKTTGVPSASIAIAQGDTIVYAQAFGLANVTPPKPAAANIAYPIGSISKQFTAQAVLLLQQQGKLSIDDPVAKYFPELTRATDVKLRNLMTMTSGYEDFAPQDYIIPIWLKNVDPAAIIHEWATKPLDFEPGTQWQYSNTNYVLLGLIVQKVTGEPLMQFLRENVLDPLHLPGIFNAYTQREKLEVTGYVSNAMAPVRVQPLEGNGWYFGDGDLAMPASTLAQWDLDILNQKLLTPASYQQFETPFTLKNGKSSNYGLGTFVRTLNSHPMLEHGGEVGGYVAENMAFPEDHLAIVVLTNQVASDAASEIAHNIATLLIPTLHPSKPTPTEDTLAPKLQSLLEQLQQGTVDRSMLTADTDAYFTADTLADFHSTLAPLGKLESIARTSTNLRGGMTYGGYKATFTNGAVTVSTYLTKDGKLEQLLITGKA
jgi:D-alanyl-D-alanine carboxypeptidase